MEEAIPVDTTWERPKILKKSTRQKQEAFKKEVSKTKQVLLNTSFKTPPSPESPILSEIQQRKNLFSLNSLNSMSQESSANSPIPEANEGTMLGAVREWRGVTEEKRALPSPGGAFSPGAVGTPSKKLSGAKKLSAMLKSTGGTAGVNCRSSSMSQQLVPYTAHGLPD